MNTAKALTSTAKQPYSGSTANLAHAMAEMENSSPAQGLNPFAEAMKKSGRQLPDYKNGKDSSFSDAFAQQEELKKEQLFAAQQRRLHAEVNPIDQQAIFDAREKQVKAQIDQLKAQLIPIAKQVEEAQPQVFTPLHSETAEPGQTGKGLLAYFEGLSGRLKEYNKNVKDSGTWLNVGKQKRGLGQGNVTKNVQNTMWHENSNNGGAG